MEQYITSIKTFAAALLLQVICNITMVLGMITIADITGFLTMLATAFAMLNGLVLFIKNLRESKKSKAEPGDKN